MSKDFKLSRSKEWWLARARAEGDSVIAAGVPDRAPEEFTASLPGDDDDFDDDDTCPNCGGEGRVEDCFEDTCVCLNPPCVWKRCDWCGGTG